ncbi:hypothetical protein GCM10009798_07330 [Nocardioides panacihumi]|uniref:Uncharacterized protein n=1 Tax=Nocardioides panacihumi TaxID=400774 RepID=A0ABN2QE44_9ACTN
MTTMVRSLAHTRGPSTRTRVLVLVLAVAVPAATVPVLVVDGVLHGHPVMNGSARGTALVMLAVALPALVAGLRVSSRGSVRGWALLLGALAYIAYNATLLVYATPFNALFLVDVALLSLAFWALVSLFADPLPRLFAGPRLPVRGISTFILAIVVLNAAAWLARIVPELGDDPPGFLKGTGLTTNPIFVQDLAIWLPALAVVAILLRRGHPAGVLLAGAGLVFWQVEAVGVAVDQWLGQHAAPGSDVATYGGSVLFVAVALVTAVPLTLWWRAAPEARGRLLPD